MPFPSPPHGGGIESSCLGRKSRGEEGKSKGRREGKKGMGGKTGREVEEGRGSRGKKGRGREGKGKKGRGKGMESEREENRKGGEG